MSTHDEGFVRRGTRDAARWIRSPKWFVPAVAVNCVVAAIGALVPATLSGAATAALAVLGTTALGCLGTLSVALIRAPFVQRNEARNKLAGIRDERERIGTELVHQSHGFTSILRARAMEAAADNDYPTVEERANAKDWQREFPGDQAHQDRTVAEIIRAHRQAVYVLLDEAAAVGVPTSEDREILRLLSTVEVAWHLSDRIVFLAEKWAGSALPEGSAPVILVPLTDESSSRASEIGALIEQGEDLLVTARRDDNVGEDLGMEVGDWVNRSRAKVPDEFLPLYERAFSKQGGSESGLGQPWQPTTEIERCLEELCEIRQRIES